MRKLFYPLCSIIAFLATTTVSTVFAQSDGIFIQPDVDTIAACPGGTLMLSVLGGTDYHWSPAADFDDPTASMVVLTPSASQWYFVTGTGLDSLQLQYTDSIYVAIADSIPQFSVSVSTMDTICPLDAVHVTFDASNVITSVSWNTTDGVVDPQSTTGTDITPLETTEYIVTAVIGPCSVSDTFTINVIPFRFSLTSEDTIYLCLGDSATISHNVSPLGVDITWEPVDTTINIHSFGTAVVNPEVSMSYTATAVYGQCVLSTTTFVRVDSLPDTTLRVVTLMDPYCAGEMVAILAEYADTMKYPDIGFQWLPDDGQIQDSVNTGNVVIVVQDTTTFFRIMTNNACVDTSMVTLNVIPPDIPLSVTDTMLCPGDKFVVEILDPDVTDIEWTPTQGLSCTQCIDPTVTVQANPITYTVKAKKDRCTVGAMLNVTYFDTLNINIIPDAAQACPGDTIHFHFSDSLLVNIEVNISGDGSISCSNCTDPVVTYNGGQVQLIVVADETAPDRCGALGTATITMKPDQEETGPIQIVCADVPTTIPLAQYGFINPEISVNVGSVSCTNCNNPVVTIPQTTTLIVYSDSPNPNACRLKWSAILQVPEPDDVSFQLGSQPPYGGGDILDITLVTNPPPIAGTTYDWLVNETPVSGHTETISATLIEGDNTIHVEWLNSNGCHQSADTSIFAEVPTYRIPKAFTPDRMYNTHFRVDRIGNIEIQEMLVFNRWGQVVYDGTSDDGWDGRREGQAAPPEVYVYLIKLRYPSGRVVTEKGDVTLIR